MRIELFLFTVVLCAMVFFVTDAWNQQANEAEAASTLTPCAIESHALEMCAGMLAECYQPQTLAPGERSI
jgi:hypothetical protein